MRTLLALLTLLWLAVPGYAAEGKIPLFKNVYYGMSKDTVQKTTNAVPCTEDFLKGQLCSKKPITFGNQKWDQLFRFINGKLISVVLSKKFTTESLQNILRTIENNGYHIILMHTENKSIDILEEWAKGPENNANLEMMKFEKNASDAHKFVYTLIEDEGIKKTVKKLNYLSRNILELSANAPRNLRVVEVSRTKKDTLFVKFTAPIARMEDDLKNQEAINDTF